MNAFDPKLIQESQRQAWPVGAESMSVSMLKPYARNARTHSRKQIKKIAASIERSRQPPETEAERSPRVAAQSEKSFAY